MPARCAVRFAVLAVLWVPVRLPAQTAWSAMAMVSARTYDPAVPADDAAEVTFTIAPGGQWRTGGWLLRFEGVARLDPVDPDRRRADVTDASVRRITGALEWTLGVRTISWGVMEFRSVTDVVNQRDGEARWPTPGRLGQPMLGVTWWSPVGEVRVLVLPWARPRPFTGNRGRLWGGAVEPDAARYPDRSWRRHLGWAARLTSTIGQVDLGLSIFDGTTRDPGFEVIDTEGPMDAIRPVYGRRRQVGLEVQYTGSSVLGRIELNAVRDPDGSHVALGVGAEYAPTDYFATFVEGLFDSRGRAATTSFEHDLFGGARLLYPDGRLTVGATLDLVTGHLIAAVDATRRLSDDMVVGVYARSFLGRSGREPPFAPRERTSVALRIERYL